MPTKLATRMAASSFPAAIALVVLLSSSMCSAAAPAHNVAAAIQFESAKNESLTLMQEMHANVAAFETSGLRIITARGTRREVALQIGNQTRASILTRLNRSDVTEQFTPFLNTTAGQTVYNQLQAAANASFPQYLSEIVDMAEGAAVPFRALFMLVIQSELSVFIHQHPLSGHKKAAPSPPPPTHCTDILSQPELGSATHGIHGHNEDGGPGDKAINYLVNITMYRDDDRDVVEERFVAYAYAGTLAGYAWGWNRHGLVVTENIVLNLHQSYDAPPGALFGRALLACRGIDDALDLAMRRPGAAAGNVNLGEFTTGRTVSFEYDAQNGTVGVKATRHLPPQAAFSGLREAPYWYAHTNIYLVLQSASWQGASSHHRLATLHAYPPPNTTADIRRMLGDTSDANYPVYRNGSSPVDHGITCTSSIFDYHQQTIRVYTANPRTSAPVLAVTWSPDM